MASYESTVLGGERAMKRGKRRGSGRELRRWQLRISLVTIRTAQIKGTATAQPPQRRGGRRGTEAELGAQLKATTGDGETANDNDGAKS